MKPAAKANLARVLLGLPGAFILLTGATFLAVPARAAEKLQLAADSPEALSNLRGMSGAPLFAIGAILLLAAATKRLEYARPAALFLLLLIVARVASYVIDGPTPAIALFLAVPTITFGLMLAGHKLLDAAAEDAEA